jgi:hypothetical protein
MQMEKPGWGVCELMMFSRTCNLSRFSEETAPVLGSLSTQSPPPCHPRDSSSLGSGLEEPLRLSACLFRASERARPRAPCGAP